MGPKIYDSTQFYAATRRMRRRHAGESYELDLDATIRSTVDCLGFPVLKYKPITRIPEYIALIDRSSFRDHQAQLFEKLTKSLQNEGLFLVPYFFDGDPRVCCSEEGEGIVYLADLQRKYSEHRLLIFGTSEKLLDPISGKLAHWSTLLLNWKQRAILTPEATSRWGIRERILASEFLVLPATVESLSAVAEHFEVSLESDVLKSQQNCAPAQPEADGPVLLAQLKSYLGESLFRWLCACAIYPELHWDLTLHLCCHTDYSPVLRWARFPA